MEEEEEAAEEEEEAAVAEEGEAAEEEEAKQQEGQPQEEEGIQNSLERNHPPSTGIDKTSTASCQTSWDICPSTGITQPSHHSSPGSIFPYPSLQEKKCATGKTICAHGPTTF